MNMWLFHQETVHPGHQLQLKPNTVLAAYIAMKPCLPHYARQLLILFFLTGLVFNPTGCVAIKAWWETSLVTDDLTMCQVVLSYFYVTISCVTVSATGQNYDMRVYGKEL